MKEELHKYLVFVPSDKMNSDIIEECIIYVWNMYGITMCRLPFLVIRNTFIDFYCIHEAHNVRLKIKDCEINSVISSLKTHAQKSKFTLCSEDKFDTIEENIQSGTYAF